MSVSAYDRYRGSGVEWLGEVPSHWTIVQTKRAFRRRKTINAGMACEDRLALTMKGVIPRDLHDLDGLQSNDYEGYQIFEAGDLAFKLIDLQNIKTSRVGMVPTRGIMSPAYIRLEPSTPEVGRFGFWYFMALYWTQVFNNLGGGVRQTLGPDDLLTIPFPLPPPAEQIAIAAFLDSETVKIDTLVDAQRRLIDLLKEKRQAVISHAITRGLDPGVLMKSSGVDWLGEVPAHWKVSRLSAEAGFFQGKAHEPYVDEAGEHVCVTARFVSTSGQARKMCSMNISPAKPGDILMVMSDLPNGRALARAYLVADSRSYAVNQRVCAITIRHGDPRFFAYQLNRNMQLLQFNDGVEQTHLRNSAFTKLILAVPPVDEQRRIADHIDLQAAKWDQLTAEAERAVELLQERRSALISAAVTGKIDVRGLGPEQADAA